MGISANGLLIRLQVVKNNLQPFDSTSHTLISIHSEFTQAQMLVNSLLELNTA